MGRFNTCFQVMLYLSNCTLINTPNDLLYAVDMMMQFVIKLNIVQEHNRDPGLVVNTRNVGQFRNVMI